jgi:hypothetical protein
MPTTPKRSVGKTRRQKKKVGKSVQPDTVAAAEPQEPSDADRNRNWQVNHALISQAFITILRQKKRCPTQGEIEKKTGLHRNTIAKHLDQKTLNDLMDPFKFATNSIMARNVRDALNGDAQAKKLFFQTVWNTEDRHVHRFDWDTLHDDISTSRDRDKVLEDDPALAGIVR